MSSGVQLQSQGKWEKTVNGTILNQSTSVWEEISFKLKDLYQMGEDSCTSHYQWGDYYLKSSKSLTTKKPMKNMNRRVTLVLYWHIQMANSMWKKCPSTSYQGNGSRNHDIPPYTCENGSI